MVLSQIIITPANNNTLIPIGIAGKCSIRVLAVQYHDTAGAGQSRVIQLQSDSLYFPYSPARYLTWVSGGNGEISLDNSHLEYHLQNVVINGQIRVHVVNHATGAEPAGFQHCVITLDVEKINKEVEI